MEEVLEFFVFRNFRRSVALKFDIYVVVFVDTCILSQCKFIISLFGHIYVCVSQQQINQKLECQSCNIIIIRYFYNHSFVENKYKKKTLLRNSIICTRTI